MAVDAVVFVVLQKLMDLLLEESFMKKQGVIKEQLEQMQAALEKMSGFFMDAATKGSEEEIKTWINRYLRHLYYVEDSIETFALHITRQRKRFRFLMNHALFLRNFTACKMLSRKLKKTKRGILRLNECMPSGVKDASLRGSLCLSLSPQPSLQEEEDDVVAEMNHDDGGVVAEMKHGDGVVVAATNHGDGGVVAEMDHGDGVVVAETNHGDGGVVPWSSSTTPPASTIRQVSFNLRRSDASIMRERVHHSRLAYSYSYNEEELAIVGYKHRVSKLRERLAVEDEWIISVVGEPGSGKTMLARAIYGNREIKNHFQHACAFATIFKDSSTRDILLDLLKQVQKTKGGEEVFRMSSDPLERRLRAHLEDKRYLIVLDGVQSIKQWEGLKAAFPTESMKGSKIILTTCEKSVAKVDGSKEPHLMGKLTPQESWSLFLRKAGLKEEEAHRVSAEEREKIVEVCCGLPLNIVLLGSLLSTKHTVNWGEILKREENWHISRTHVMLSYNDLDPHLRLCLLYMMIFPKKVDIPVRRLQRLWLAEGFVKRDAERSKFPEDVAQDYFDNLVKRSLIMVTKLRSDGSHRKCRLLGVLRDHLRDIVHDISLFHEHGGSNCSKDGHQRRLIEYADGDNCTLSSHAFKRLRSYISFNLQKKDTPAKYVGDLVSNMIGKGSGLLRVLDLEGVYKPSLPDNLGDLFHLRYLGLRWTFLDKLPKSVGELAYLETLDLKHTFINRIPPSIWKLKHLRHLNLNEIHLDKESRLDKLNSLPQLLTLWGLSVNQDSPILNGLNKFMDLRELGISLRFNEPDQTQFAQDVLEWVSKLTRLRQLRLRSMDDSGNPGHLSNLNSFSSLQELTHMKLLGKLQKLPDINQFPPHIKVLTLSISHLNKDPMPILGQLHDLTVLRLLANSYQGERIFCPADSFKNLLVLKLWMLVNLKEWEVEEGAMEKLKELNIRCCSKLERIPTRLLQQKSFQDLILNDMPNEFKEDADSINNTNHRKFSIAVKNYGFKTSEW